MLATLSEAIPWEAFRSLIEQGYSDERRSNAGCKRTDPIILFMMLVLQQLLNPSDEELKSQVNDRRSFEDFVGLGVMNTIPDATTIAFFRERVRKTGVILESLERFEGHLRSQGLEASGWQIVNASLVSVPKQRNSREENYAIKDGAIPEKWLDKTSLLHQRDADARWVKKIGISHFGYKNPLCQES